MLAVARSAQHSDDAILPVVLVSPAAAGCERRWAGGCAPEVEGGLPTSVCEPSGQALVLEKRRLRPQEGNQLDLGPATARTEGWFCFCFLSHPV